MHARGQRRSTGSDKVRKQTRKEKHTRTVLRERRISARRTVVGNVQRRGRLPRALRADPPAGLHLVPVCTSGAFAGFTAPAA